MQLLFICKKFFAKCDIISNMSNIKDRMYISTVCEKVEELAVKYGCGIEAANFSYAENMDTYFDETKKKIDKYKEVAHDLIFHAPFYEIAMCAIDPMARDFAKKRLKQFYDIVKVYAPKKLIFHTGYIHPGYFKEWFIPKTAEFLNEFAREIESEEASGKSSASGASDNDGVNGASDKVSAPIICIENVLETEPEMFLEIMKKLDNDRVKVCIDIGHVNVYSDKINGLSGTDLVCHWIEVLSLYISHFHLHSNDGKIDRHLDINDGTLDINKIIAFAEKKIDKPTYTFEIIDVKSELPINEMAANV